MHGLGNPSGLHIQYHLERTAPDALPPPPVPDPLLGVRVVGEWVATEDHMGFPGIAHGGLLLALVDDVIGRCAALRHRWVVTGHLDCRFRAAAPVGNSLRVEGWLTRWQRRAVRGVGRVLLPDGTLALEAEGVYLPVTDELAASMVQNWDGFSGYLDVEDPLRD